MRIRNFTEEYDVAYWKYISTHIISISDRCIDRRGPKPKPKLIDEIDDTILNEDVLSFYFLLVTFDCKFTNFAIETMVKKRARALNRARNNRLRAQEAEAKSIKNATPRAGTPAESGNMTTNGNANEHKSSSKTTGKMGPRDSKSSTTVAPKIESNIKKDDKTNDTIPPSAASLAPPANRAPPSLSVSIEVPTTTVNPYSTTTELAVNSCDGIGTLEYPGDDLSGLLQFLRATPYPQIRKRHIVMFMPQLVEDLLDGKVSDQSFWGLL